MPLIIAAALGGGGGVAAVSFADDADDSDAKPAKEEEEYAMIESVSRQRKRSIEILNISKQITVV